MDVYDIQRELFKRINKYYYIFTPCQFRRENEDSLLLINKYSNSFELLNATAAIVLLMCNSKHCIEDIFGRIKEIFSEVPDSVLIKDLLEIINLFKTRHLCYKLEVNNLSLESFIYKKSQVILREIYDIIYKKREKVYIPPRISVLC